MTEQPEIPMEQLIREDGRYPPEAYEFLHAGLTKAVSDTHGEDAVRVEAEPGQNHVTGQQMCVSLRNLAIERWGMLAKTVLAQWNIRETLDFGNMVYLLIRNSYMRKTDEDSIDDFRDVFDFDAAFDGIDHFELAE